MTRPLFSSLTLVLFLVLTASSIIAQDDPSTTGDEAKAASEKSSEMLKIGSPAPALNIEHWISDAGGKFKPVTELETGKVYVVEFWATWCKPCIRSMPHLAKVQTKYIDQSVQVISLSDEPLKKVEKFLERDYKPRKRKSAKGSSEQGSKSTPKTYAELTSAYCLTTDPDRSVYNDYFRASGRRGIPSAYIVGKTGLIEWMGHPNKMDNALKSVVNDSWDRVAFAKENVAVQKRDLALTRISRVLRTSTPEEVEKAFDEALEKFADDPAAITMLNDMKAGIVMSSFRKVTDSDENIKFLATIKELNPTVSKKLRPQLLRFQVQFQLRESQFDEATKTLTLIGSKKAFPATELARIAEDIYKQSTGNEEFPQAIFVHGTALCQKAVDTDGNNPYFLNALACMQHRSGDLDAATETQTMAVAKSNGRSKSHKGYQVFLEQLKAEKDSMDEPETKSVEAAQPQSGESTLVVGSEANLSAVKGADWIQGEGPKSWEPGKVYMFECWATWCGPCIALIPHVNELHKKYYDKGLRVHGMSSWEEDKDAVEKFVQKKGAGMSYPVAFTNGSSFEKKWLDAAGVKSIPHAFIVRNGKLLLATEASRITDSLIETILSGDEGAKQAAALIAAANNSREKTDELVEQINAAGFKKDAKTMAASLKELETVDPGHPELPILKLKLMIAGKEWPAAVSTLNEMPATNSKNSFVMMAGMRMARNNGRDYPMDFIKALTIPYSQYVADSGKAIGPNHFACLSILHWKIGDKQTATAHADKGVEVAKNFSRASESRTDAFKRFAKSVHEGTMPEFSELLTWHREGKKKAAAKNAKQDKE